jgi:hypothetical protein
MPRASEDITGSAGHQLHRQAVACRHSPEQRKPEKLTRPIEGASSFHRLLVHGEDARHCPYQRQSRHALPGAGVAKLAARPRVRFALPPGAARPRDDVHFHRHSVAGAPRSRETGVRPWRLRGPVRAPPLPPPRRESHAGLTNPWFGDRLGAVPRTGRDHGDLYRGEMQAKQTGGDSC